MNSSIELKENLNTWSKEHQLKAVRDVLKENSNIKFDIIKVNKLNDIDFLKVAIVSSYEQLRNNKKYITDLNEEIKLYNYYMNIFLGDYCLDSRRKIKVEYAEEVGSGLIVYTVNYRKHNYIFYTDTINKMKKAVKELLKE